MMRPGDENLLSSRIVSYNSLRRAHRIFALFLSGLALALTIPFVVAKPRYATTQIAVPADGEKLQIDQAGDIAGTTVGGRAFLYSNGAVTYLGPLPGDTYSSVSSMSANGRIVGISYTSTTRHTFVYQDGVMTEPGDAVVDKSGVWDINNDGVVVGGTYGDPYDPGGPYTFSGGSVSLIANFVSYSGSAYAINNVGTVVGTLSTTGFFGVTHAFVYANNTLTNLPGISTDVDSSAVDVNDLDQIIGTVGDTTTIGANIRGFLYSNGVVIDLGKMAIPIAINNQGQIIGSSSRVAEDAYLYENGHAVDLNTLINSKWTLSEPQSINDSGIIIGMGDAPGAAYVGIELTPLPILAVPGKKNLTTNHTSTLIRGRADSSTSRVLFRVGTRGKFKPARGTVKWHFVAQLKEGENQITIRSLGLNGYSDTMRLTITRD